MASQERISVYSLSDLKNTSDDAIPAYLNSIGFKQNHRLTDTRLALGYSAFIVCALTFAWDFKLGFDETKYYTAAAVALYTAINGVLTFWIWAVENGIVYVGFNKNGDKIEVSTSTKRHTPIYKVVAKTYPKAGGDPTTITVIKPFSQWFDAAGRFVAQPFQAMLATKVPIISKADPKRAEPVVATKTVEDDTVTNDRWAGLLASSSGMDALTAAASTSGADSKGAKKRSKKA